MSAPTLEQPRVEAPAAAIGVRPVLWFAGNAGLTGLACAGLLLTGIAYGVDPNGFTAGVAALLAAIAVVSGVSAWGHRRAFFALIDGGVR